MILLLANSTFPAEGPAENSLTLSAKSTRINLQTSAADFKGGIVINHGNMKISAETLAQQNNSDSKREQMLLTGNPARIEFKQQATNLEITIEAAKILFFPNDGFLEISGNSQLKTTDNGTLQTAIKADTISVKLTTKKIESIIAKGKENGTPLSYQFSPKQGEKIIASAEQLTMNQISGDVELHNATVNQGSNQLRAGLIQIDGKTGNLSANSGGNIRPSLSFELDLDTLEQTEREKKQQEQQP